MTGGVLQMNPGSSEVVTMGEIEERQHSDLGQLKAKAADEFLVKIGAKEEEFEWDPKITNEKLHRSQSFICPEYHKPAVYRHRPKVVEASPWQCNSQAVRQLSLIPRFGPRKLFINNRNIHNIGDGYLGGNMTQARGLCFIPKSVNTL